MMMASRSPRPLAKAAAVLARLRHAPLTVSLGLLRIRKPTGYKMWVMDRAEAGGKEERAEAR